jgi:YfiH family protein
MSDRPDPILSPALSRLPGVRHAFFTRAGGVSDGVYATLNGGTGSADDPARVAENRGRMAEWMGVRRSHLLSVWQHHSPDALIVREPWEPANRPKADAMATDVAGIALAIGTADCGPVLFADAAAGVVGGAHAGWKGALTGVLEATLDAMEQLGARRARVTASLGPMISCAAYEVGPEFVARFIEKDAGNARFFAPSSKAGHSMFDLPAYIVRRLYRAGVGEVENLGVCTYGEESRLFSYRRMTHRGEKDYGRQMSAIALG